MDNNASSYLVVQTPGDRHLLNQLNGGKFLKYIFFKYLQNNTLFHIFFLGLSGSASTAHFPSYAPSASNSIVPPGGPALHVTGRGTTLVIIHF